MLEKYSLRNFPATYTVPGTYKCREVALRGAYKFLMVRTLQSQQ